VTTDQILWATNTGLITIVGVLIWDWKNSVKETFVAVNKTFEKIDKRFENLDAEKVSVSTCEILHGEVKKKAHSHAILGHAGEVIQ